MVGAAAVDRFNNRRDERITYILRTPEKRHPFGITSLALSDSELFTAGRDGTVRARWLGQWYYASAWLPASCYLFIWHYSQVEFGFCTFIGP